MGVDSAYAYVTLLYVAGYERHSFLPPIPLARLDLILPIAI